MSDAAKNSVLIVDDEKLNIEVLSNILTPEYTIFMTKRGKTAIELAEKYMPDLILLDIIMPDMNGFDVLAALKKSEKTQKIPVIIITGLGGVEDEEKGLALEAADFIHKPFSTKIVKARVHLQMQIINQIRALEQYAHIQAAIVATEEKSKFFAKMSHEMRTPLNAVIGLAELTLEAGGLSEEVYANVENISDAGASLLGLVNDILDISKIESGKFALVPVEYAPPVMISDVITQCIMLKGDKPIEMILNIDENIPNVLYGDDLRIKQILINLLSNAFKYTKEGTVELNIKSELLNNDGVLLIVSVIDTGIGIKNEDIGRLFSEYTQMDVKSNRKTVGTGLGLSITKMIVELMGGTILVKSEYGKGSVFTVKVPQKSINSEVIGTEVADKMKKLQYHSKKRTPRLPRISLPYARVLVVDDVLVNLDVARGMMKPYKMQVDCVTSGQQAIDAIREEKVRYNAIFMDHMMPEMDGIEATRIIHEEIGTEYAKNIPIIAFTANAITGNEEMFLSKGFRAFISKPIDMARLDSVIRQWVRDEEFEKTLTNQQIKVGGEVVFDTRDGYDRRSGRIDRRLGYDRRFFANGITGVNINKGLERFSGDWETYLSVLKSFLTNTRSILETVKEVNRETLSDYAITVHGIKSSCRGICAEEAGHMAEALEKAAKYGDLVFVTAKNPAFIETVSALITEIDCEFAKNVEKKDKPKKDKPYKEALSELIIACKGFNAIKVDSIMDEIEVFDYEADDGLVLWLRENVNQMNFMEIVEKLSSLE